MTIGRSIVAATAIAAFAACGTDSGASDLIPDASPGTGTATTSPAGAGPLDAADPCGLFAPDEVAALTGASGSLQQVPDEPAPGLRSCSWRNRQQEGAMLIVDRCNGTATRGLNDPVPADQAADDEPCFWQPGGQERIPGIGRDARVHLMSEDGMPSFWVAEALLDNAAIEAWVHEAAGRDIAIRFLRAAVQQLSAPRS